MDKQRYIFTFGNADSASAPGVRLETCQREEQYCGSGDITTEAARHLFRVAAGLESPLLGEMAILNQIKNAYEEALHEGKLPAGINRLFQTALHVGHRARTETMISRGAVSYSQVTVDILCHEMPDLGEKTVSIIGVNDLTESILNFLTARGASNLILANRTFAKASQMAERYGAAALPLTEKHSLLGLSDVVISATSAPHTLIHRSDYEASDRRQLLFDLANPQDIDPEVGWLIGKHLYNLRDIEQQAQQNLRRRQQEAVRCEEIIEEEIAALMAWQEYRKKRIG